MWFIILALIVSVSSWTVTVDKNFINTTGINDIMMEGYIYTITSNTVCSYIAPVPNNSVCFMRPSSCIVEQLNNAAEAGCLGIVLYGTTSYIANNSTYNNRTIYTITMTSDYGFTLSGLIGYYIVVFDGFNNFPAALLLIIFGGVVGFIALSCFIYACIKCCVYKCKNRKYRKQYQLVDDPPLLYIK